MFFIIGAATKIDFLWTGFYMTGAFVMKELKEKFDIISR